MDICEHISGTHSMSHVLHFPFVLTWELCIQGAGPPREFIRRNNNQCTSLGCWASRSILQLSVCWNSGWDKCSLLWLRTRRTQQYFPSRFHWNEKERILFGDCIIPLLWGQAAAQSQQSIWEFREWWWRCWNIPALITSYHLMMIIKADSKQILFGADPWLALCSAKCTRCCLCKHNHPQ